MGPLAVFALILLLPSVLSDTLESLERMGGTPSNASWWPV
jgi:hypothetical protein